MWVSSNRIQKLYANPVRNFACPDPFVLKYLNEYWCYSTGLLPDGRCFGAFHSRDLVNWRSLGGVMEPFDRNAPCYRAPEVIYENGLFLMYYSVGNEERMQIRVATADDPAGPFIDAGVPLTAEDFAIDPHVLRDEDGRWYLFYVTDFLQHTHIGTGTVCDVMLDPFRLKGEPQPITRALYDWQIYDPQRKEKGGVRWHTIEGPFVLKHKGFYYQMFSGGNWKNKSYGVAYAISDSVLSPQEWKQFADGERILPILRTIPGRVISPGHNSAIRGPDNLQQFCIYHRWAENMSDRVLAIDRLDWAGERLFVIGATATPQPAPGLATFVDFFDEECRGRLGEGWRSVEGKWKVRNNTAVQEATEGAAEARCLRESSHFVAEVSLRLLRNVGADGAIGIKLLAGEETVLLFHLLPGKNLIVVGGQLFDQAERKWTEQTFALPLHFNPEVYHHLRVEADSLRIRITLDESLLKWEGRLSLPPHSFAFSTSNASATFRGFALTEGWQDFFMESHSSPGLLGWHSESGDDVWSLGEKHLWHVDPGKRDSVITKGRLPRSYELVVNARLCGQAEADEYYGFLPALAEDDSGPLLTVERFGDVWGLRCRRYACESVFYLPDDFDPFAYNQFRFHKGRDEMLIQHESRVIGKIQVPESAAKMGLYASGTIAAFDMVRVTAIRDSNKK